MFTRCSTKIGIDLGGDYCYYLAVELGGVKMHVAAGLVPAHGCKNALGKAGASPAATIQFMSL